MKFEKISISVLLVALALAPHLVFGEPRDCKPPNWNKDFTEVKRRDDEYRRSIQKYFESYFSQHKISADRIKKRCEDLGQRPKATTSLESLSTQNKCVSTQNLKGLEGLPCFRYHIIPARKVSKGTVVRFQGGPADLLQFSRFQLDDFDILTFNDIGVGDNSFELGSAFQWKHISHEVQADLLKRILVREKIKRYALYGGSYGSVSATVLGSQLSQTGNPPVGVLLVGVVGASAGDKRGKSDTAIRIPKTGSKVSFDGSPPCILKETAGCADAKYVQLLSEEDKTRFYQKIETMGDPAIRALIRDALHWEYVRSPAQAAQFAKDYLLAKDENINLKCWFDSEFMSIPWLNRFKSASQNAFYEVMSCFMSSSSESCRCLGELPAYDSALYQIAPPAKLYYINGDSDSQTPLSGARSHFDLQKNPQKSFLKVCGAGHVPVRDRTSDEEKSISANEIFLKIFSDDIEGFQKLPTFCEREMSSQPNRKTAD